ncbi:LysR family transcriptional regulator, partial [Streptomyces sp. NPDC058642]|uniref:helix-turn-helix domain-containing protein n=1 Tax=Streptomyces sp. NPDC058642 TaxID=3346572 RepID=UPI0036601212
MSRGQGVSSGGVEHRVDPVGGELAYLIDEFVQAAERLGITQPPLYRAIAPLEWRVGVPLLERTTRKVTRLAGGRSSRRARAPSDGPSSSASCRMTRSVPFWSRLRRVAVSGGIGPVFSCVGRPACPATRVQPRS